jgi:chitinase
MATPANRTAFVQAAVALVEKYNLDGIDFECAIFFCPIDLTEVWFYSWEYPNRQGVGCNTISPDDSANFISFLQELRQQPLGQNITLSAAVSVTPFAGTDGKPMGDVSAFAKVLDYIGEKLPGSQGCASG